MMNRSIAAAVLLMSGSVPALLLGQTSTASTTHREGSWEFGVSGGALQTATALRNFLTSGTPESRFADPARGGRIVPTAEARIGYNFNRHVGITVGAEGERGGDVTSLSPNASIALTTNLNARTAPFLLVGTEITRITGLNDRVTHSTWGAHAGLGLRHMLTENLALRIEGRARFAGYREVPMSRSNIINPMAQIGLSYFGPGRKPVVTIVERERVGVRVDTVTITKVQIVTRVDTVLRAPGIDAEQAILRVQFQTNRAEILPQSRPVLDTVAMAIMATPNSFWAIEGHTDSIGSATRNTQLSLQRAQAIEAYLVTRGVNGSVLTSAGFGPSRPVSTNATEEGRAANRRVQMRRRPAAPPTRVP